MNLNRWLRIPALVVAAFFVFALPAWGVDKICLDFAGLDARTDLTAQQKADLKDKIKAVVKANMGDDYQIVSGATDCEGAKRTIHFKKDAHNPDDRYGDWENGSSDVNVYIGAFMDDANVSGSFKNGADWDLDKLANGLGETGCHECGHSYSVGHNTHDPPDKMTEGGKVSAATRAAGGRHFDDPAKKTMKENLGKDPCKSAADYDDKAVASYQYDIVPLGPNKEEDGFDETTRWADARLTVSGAAPGFFFGYIAGTRAHPYFVAKSSLESGFQLDYLTWFQFGPAHRSLLAFVIAPTGGSNWFPPDSVSFSNPTSFSGNLIYRNLTLSWFSLGITINLDAAFNNPLAANGWGPGCFTNTDCNDSNPCTADFCNPSLGCVHDPGPGLSCFDGVACHQQGRCDPTQPGANPVTGCWFPDNCDHSNPCIVTTCDAASGACLFTSNPPPGEAAAASLQAVSKTKFTWGPTPGARSYDLVRGRLGQFPVGPGGADESCAGGLPGPYVEDVQTVPVAQGFWYIVRASNGCTAGPYGFSSIGPRNTTTCDHGTFYRDEVDVASDPLIGGCHYAYTSNTCGAGKKFYASDTCDSNGRHIWEWTDNTCHTTEPDVVRLDCDQICVNQHKDRGQCTYGLDPLCPLNGMIPARCMCFP